MLNLCAYPESEPRHGAVKLSHNWRVVKFLDNDLSRIGRLLVSAGTKIKAEKIAKNLKSHDQRNYADGYSIDDRYTYVVCKRTDLYILDCPY